MHIIRAGVTRTVLLVGRWAVKVPSLRGIGPAPMTMRGRVAGFCRGVLANQSEYTWHTVEGFQGRVAPVLRSWPWGVVQVYPRCEPAPCDAELFFLYPDPGDGAEVGKHENFGLLDGRLVRVDYEV
jgi:hypothetical protein